MTYGAIDLHKKESQIRIVAEDGEVIDRRIATRRDAFTRLFGERPRMRVLLEASTESEWVACHLESLGHEGYITVGLFDDGTPGEIFLTMAKEGSTISGFADAFAQAISYALQYGVPLQVLVDKFSHARFEPSGMTKNPEVRFAKSIVDYIFRWMATKFLSPEAQFRVGVNLREEPANEANDAPGNVGSGNVVSGFSRTDAARIEPKGAAASSATETTARPKASEFAAMRNQEDAPPCSTCGSIMIRSGSCYKCANCGTTSGCA